MLFRVRQASLRMVHFCVVPGCSNKSDRDTHLSFHRLPLKNKSLLKIWIHKIGRKNLPLNKNSCVCSEHFPGGRRLLVNDEYPTLKLPKLSTQVVHCQVRDHRVQEVEMVRPFQHRSSVQIMYLNKLKARFVTMLFVLN